MALFSRPSAPAKQSVFSQALKDAAAASPTVDTSYGAAQGWVTAPGIEGNTVKVFSKVDPRTGLPILNQAALDSVLKKYNSETLNKDQYRDNYNAFGWNAKSDASSVAHGPAVFGIKKTVAPMGGAVSYSGDMKSVAQKLGLNPAEFKTQDQLYNAIADKTKNLYLVSNTINGNNHASILFVSDGQGNLVAASNPATKQPAVQYYDATRNVTGESWLASLGPIPAIALSAIAPQLGLTVMEAAAIQGAMQIAAGGSVEDAIKYAAASVAASQVPGVLKDMGAQVGSESIQKVLDSAAASATKAALTGGDVTKAALGAAFVSGGVSAAEAASTESAGTGLKMPGQVAAPSGAGEASLRTDVAGTAPEIITGTGIAASPTALLSKQLAPYALQGGDVISGGAGTVQPRYTGAADIITPSSLQQYLPEYQPPESSTGTMDRGLSTSEKKALSEALKLGFSSLYGSDTGGGGSQTTYAATDVQRPTALPVGQYAPGSQALAQALRIGDVGAPIFGTDKDEGKKAGWNVESLRYMGNVGEA